MEYYSPLQLGGERRDSTIRPELSRGSVEYVAPGEYMVSVGVLGGRGKRSGGDCGACSGEKSGPNRRDI